MDWHFIPVWGRADKAKYDSDLIFFHGAVCDLLGRKWNQDWAQEPPATRAHAFCSIGGLMYIMLQSPRNVWLVMGRSPSTSLVSNMPQIVVVCFDLRMIWTNDVTLEWRSILKTRKSHVINICDPVWLWKWTFPSNAMAVRHVSKRIWIGVCHVCSLCCILSRRRSTKWNISSFLWHAAGTESGCTVLLTVTQCQHFWEEREWQRRSSGWAVSPVWTPNWLTGVQWRLLFLTLVQTRMSGYFFHFSFSLVPQESEPKKYISPSANWKLIIL